MYHPTAGHWVLAEILATVTGRPYADAIEAMVTEPLGLPRLLAVPLDAQDGIIDAVGVGAPPTPAEMLEAFGVEVDVAALIPPDVALGALLTLNDPDARALGVPGGGGVMRAADLALLYQGLLHDPVGLWSPEILAAGTRDVRMTLPDLMGVPANRTLGLVVAGDGFRPPPGFRPYRLAPCLRPQRRRRPARLRRPRDRPQRGLRHRRHGPAPDPPEPSRHRHRLPRRRLLAN